MKDLDISHYKKNRLCCRWFWSVSTCLASTS